MHINALTSEAFSFDVTDFVSVDGFKCEEISRTERRAAASLIVSHVPAVRLSAFFGDPRVAADEFIAPKLRLLRRWLSGIGKRCS